MAGKRRILTSPRLGYALDKLSKNALIDLVADLADLEFGEGEATDEQVAVIIQGWLGPILRVRKDRPVSLIDLMTKFDASEEDRRNRTGKFAPTPEPAP